MRKLIVLLTCALVLGACRFTLTSPSPPTQTQTTNVTVTPPPTPPTPPTPLPPTTTIPPGNGSPGTPLPLPANGITIAQQYAASHRATLATSCQATHGAAAWQYLDGLIATLKQSDARWGYVCQYGQCGNIGADVVGYLASGTPAPGAKGMWTVDVIGGHCGSLPADTWNVLGFDAAGTWTPTRF